MTWFPGPGWHSRRSKLSREARHQPFTPRLPALLLKHPAILGLVLATAGVGLSIALITTMHRWPNWLLLPSMFLAVVSMGATAVGFSLLAVLGLQPLIESKEATWGDEPLRNMGMSSALRHKCEGLGYWTCESLSEAVEKSLFPWRSLEYDERLQVDRAVQRWRAGSRSNDDR